MINSSKSTMLEKICYGLGGVGSNFVWTFMAMYVTLYYTNSIGISAAAAGTMMLIARLFDGISDIFFAWVIRKSNFKMGKIKPWIIISAPLLALSLLASFNVPGTFSDTGKLVYVYITYTFTAAISYTIFNLAFASILPLMSYDNQDRVKASSVYNFILMSGLMLMIFLSPVLLAKFGGVSDGGAWSSISIIYSIICLVGVLLMGIVIKEKEPPENPNTIDEKNVAILSFKETLKIILSSKYTWMLLIVFFVFYLFNGASSGIGIYYFMYVIGDIELANFGKIGLYGMLAQLVMILILPKLILKFGRKRTIVGGIIVSIIGSVVLLVSPSNLILAIATGVARTVGMTPIMVLIYVYIADITDEIALNHHGCRPAETVSMISSIGTKIGTGIGSALVGWTLALFSYNAESLVQSDYTINGIVQFMVWIPVITLGIAGFIISRWNIGADAKKTL